MSTSAQLTEKYGLQAREEIRKRFGKYFSKHWLKHQWISLHLEVENALIHSSERFPILCMYLIFPSF